MNNHRSGNNGPQSAASRRRWITIGSLACVALVTFLLAHSKGQYDALYPAAGAAALVEEEQQLSPEALKQSPPTLEECKIVLKDALGKEDDHDRAWAFKEIYNTNEWSSPESKSGKGSEMRYTERVRKLIDYTISKFNLHTFADAPCGDCAWQTHLLNFPHINYTGMDIVPDLILGNSKKHSRFSNARFINLDLVLDELPSAEVYMVRDVVQHLSLEDGVALLKNVERTGAKYLISNFHNLKRTGEALENRNIEAGRFYPNNLMMKPFNFPKPLYYILDMHDGYFERENEGMGIKLAAVWKLPALDKGDGVGFDVDFEKAKDLVFLDRSLDSSSLFD
ncbi:hypothetical protein P389DRAFT_81006 [Cystobasidium minutum MCA 4210]|uniref:uncharacterized protein n=1 Tax=Cystobasidium minutum MCA 4210 TaxID=1397322 RepID=UPI0034CFB8BD|eukprot:jgi/Rhomi1/81006/CE81005_3050